MRLVAIVAATSLAVALTGCDNPVGIPGAGGPKPAPGKNTFVGAVKAEWLNPEKPADYYRDMKLLEAFSYVDPEGVVWEVPAGSITNGASVPWGFWNIVGGPYDGPYRDAAVVHDFFCDSKTRTWEETHRMFYSAMLARGVSDSLARTMYAGVRYGGPRWEVVTPPPAEPQKSGFLDMIGFTRTAKAGESTPPAAPAAPDAPAPAPAPAPAAAPAAPAADVAPVPTAVPQRPLQNPDEPAPPIRSIGRSFGANKELRTFDDIRQWIEKENPSLEEIDRRVEEMRRLEGKPIETP